MGKIKVIFSIAVFLLYETFKEQTIITKFIHIYINNKTEIKQ